MRLRPRASTIGNFNSLRLLIAAALLWPAIAGAQPPNPTASDANRNTAAGTNALLNVIAGSNNTAIGTDALKSTTTGFNNTASGRAALMFNTTGTDNTSSGTDALRANGIGSANTASGTAALFANTTGNRNSANGRNALFSNTTGNDNTASGVNSLFANTTGRSNTALGAQALSTNTTGVNNVAVGFGALFKMNGNGNIAVGVNAGKNIPSGSNNIYIGHAGFNVSETGVTRIGAVQSKVFVAGIAGAPLAGATVVVRSNGQLGVVASSARYKQDIQNLDDASGSVAEKLARLRPVSYRYKADPEAAHYGLIAEEVDKVMPELVVRDGQNRPESVQYLEIVPLLLQDRREQRAEIARQRALIERLATEVAELRSARFADNTGRRLK